MIDPWALSALWAASPLVAKPFVTNFRASTALPQTAAGLIARTIGAHLVVGRSQASRQRNQPLSSTDITSHRNSKVASTRLALLQVRDCEARCRGGRTRW
jgi:transposase InsO family protein